MMRQIVPAVFKCREHDHVLTAEVVVQVLAPGQPSTGGFRFGGRRTSRPFKVIVRCPKGEGHDLVFSGTLQA